jgi:acyl-CoA thioester hydrolase
MHVIYHYEHVVSAAEIDGQGHASNVAYVSWMQDAAIAHSTANGWSPRRYLDLGEGWVARSHHIEYLRPAFEAEQIVIETWVSGFRNVSSTRRYEMFRAQDREMLARAETRWAFVRFETGKPRPIPLELRQAFVIADRP